MPRADRRARRNPGHSVAARETQGTEVSQGLIARVVSGLKYVVSGVGPLNWFGPQQPLPPQAQDATEGRAFDYPVGYNLRIQPREGENVSFQMLRSLADGYDLLRLVIETRKDQIESFDWEIVPKNKDDSGDTLKAEIDRVTEFFGSPDKEHNWPQWLRMQIEDLLVLDAIAVYPRPNRGGELYGFELIDPATLKRVIDDGGRTPLPPDPAYQQVLKGIPAADYSRDQLVYMMRNPRTNRIYGYSPVEQVMMTVNIALRRQLSQLDFYTAGNIPEAIAQVPESWTAQQLKDFQGWWDSLMEGNSAAKRKMRFIPMLKDIFFPKKEVLKDEYDEWLARIVCFAFSISPSALIKQVNRASGEQMADTAKEEGLMPLLRFIEAHVTALVQKYLQAPNLKFQFKVVNRVDPKSQAEIHGTYIEKKVLTPDEVREDLGRDAMTAEQREAAFPTPVTPGFNADGTPIEPVEEGATVGKDGKPLKGAAAANAPAAAPAPKEEPTVAEKMLSKMLDMIDPERIAKLLIERVRAEPPVVIEHRPEISVEVGDTNVHVPAPRGGDDSMAKRAARFDEALLEFVKRETPAPVINVDATSTHTINVPERSVVVNAGDVQVDAPITVATPTVSVDAPVTVNVPPAQVEIQPAPHVATRETIERDHNGEIVAVTKTPLK